MFPTLALGRARLSPSSGNSNDSNNNNNSNNNSSNSPIEKEVTTNGSNDDNFELSPVKKNLNMISASTHVVGDTLRTLSVIFAAITSSLTGIHVDKVDAWAAIVVAFTMLFVIFPLVKDIIHCGLDIYRCRRAQGKWDYGRSTHGRGHVSYSPLRTTGDDSAGTTSALQDFDDDILTDYDDDSESNGPGSP